MPKLCSVTGWFCLWYAWNSTDAGRYIHTILRECEIVTLVRLSPATSAFCVNPRIATTVEPTIKMLLLLLLMLSGALYKAKQIG